MHSGELIEQALRLAVDQVWPVALAAGAAALLVGVIVHRVGLVDPTVVVLIARAAAVLAVLAAGGAAWFAETAAWTSGLWAQIGEIGRGAP